MSAKAVLFVLGLILGISLPGGLFGQDAEILEFSGKGSEPPEQAVISPSEPRAGRSVIAPPSRGFYLGQTTFNLGEISQLEEIVGGKVAIVADYSLIRGTEEPGAPLRFDLSRANAYADRGYAIVVSAYEAHPGHGGFTVDRLLRGEYDRQLSDLAAKFRSFRGNMFFHVCREPNGVLRDFFGGFGPNGDKDLKWAIETRRGLAEFQPPAGPPGAPDLYRGLGRDDVADGIERLGAAQRYYYDFFIRREGLTNLTFDTMGWATPGPGVDRGGVSGHEEKLQKSFSIERLLAAIGPYYDWVSVTWHLYTEPESETGFPPSDGPRLHAAELEKLLAVITRAAGNRPVLISEFGILTPFRKEKAEIAMDVIMDLPQIKGIIFWGAKTTGNPYDGALRPGEPAAEVLRVFSRKHPELVRTDIITQR